MVGVGLWTIRIGYRVHGTSRVVVYWKLSFTQRRLVLRDPETRQYRVCVDDQPVATSLLDRLRLPGRPVVILHNGDDDEATTFWGVKPRRSMSEFTTYHVRLLYSRLCRRIRRRAIRTEARTTP
ncbi:MAG TPA: hypothetical protein VI322_02460 [Candidatus Saccharimonadia bacterium]